MHQHQNHNMPQRPEVLTREKLNRRIILLLIVSSAFFASISPAETYTSHSAVKSAYQDRAEIIVQSRTKAGTEIQLKIPASSLSEIVVGAKFSVVRKWSEGRYTDIAFGFVKVVGNGNEATILKRDDKTGRDIEKEDLLYLVKTPKPKPSDPPEIIENHKYGFSFGQDNWILDQAKLEGGKIEADGNALRIQVSQDSGGICPNRNWYTGDFNAAVSARQISGGGNGEYGIILYEGGWKEVLRFSVAADGHWRVVSGSDELASEWHKLDDVPGSSSIKIRVKREGTKFTMFVNEKPLGRISSKTSVLCPALFASTWEEGGAVVEFQNFEVTSSK